MDKSQEVFQKLLARDGVTASDVSRATGIATGNLSDWKSGRSHPKLQAMQKIADYFGVSLTYLLTGEETDPGRRLSRPAVEIATAADERLIYRKVCQAAMELSDDEMSVIIKVIKLISKK